MTHPIEPLPPSAKLVYKVLEYEGACTRSEIEDYSFLGDTTVNGALRRLEGKNIVEREYHTSDPGKPVYRIPPEFREKAEA